METDWKKLAPCRGHHLEMDWDRHTQQHAALFVGKFCKNCPAAIKAECLELGLELLPLPDNRVLPVGVWGGLSLNQRRKLYENRD